jgi:transposase
VIADGAGRAIAFQIAPGQAHELPQAVPLLERLPGVPRWVVADRGYTSHAFREHVWDLGARPAIPPQRHEAPVACPNWIYHNRNRVERLWARLKEWRRRHPLREDRAFLHGRALPRGRARLAQTLTDPSRLKKVYIRI